MNYDKVYRNGNINLFIHSLRKCYLAQIKGFEQKFLFKRDFLQVELYGDGDYGWMILNNEKSIYEYSELNNEKVYFMYGKDSLVLLTKKDVINFLNNNITFDKLKEESDLFQKKQRTNIINFDEE